MLGCLPALRDDTKWLAGFHNIIDHLGARSHQWSLDQDRRLQHRHADITAYVAHWRKAERKGFLVGGFFLLKTSHSFSSFIESRGQSLHDLNLYVSSENYFSTTRPAYSRLLPWPELWFLPSQLRAAAKARTNHLNLPSLDVDDENEGDHKKSALELIPESLRPSRQSISALLSQPQITARFRLDGLVDSWLEPLHELLGEQRYLLSDQALSSVDCLAFAFLALGLYAPVPRPWLKESITGRYPTLLAYVNRLAPRLLGDSVGVNDTIRVRDPRSADTGASSESSSSSSPRTSPKEGRGSEGILPWREPQPRGLRLAAMDVLDHVLMLVHVHVLPFIGDHIQEGNIVTATTTTTTETVSPKDPDLPRLSLLPTVLAVGSAVAAGGYVLTSLIPFSHDERAANKSNRSDLSDLSGLGEAGALLAMADLGRHNAISSDRPREDGTAPVAEVALTVEENAD